MLRLAANSLPTNTSHVIYSFQNIAFNSTQQLQSLPKSRNIFKTLEVILRHKVHRIGCYCGRDVAGRRLCSCFSLFSRHPFIQLSGTHKRSTKVITSPFRSSSCFGSRARGATLPITLKIQLNLHTTYPVNMCLFM